MHDRLPPKVYVQGHVTSLDFGHYGLDNIQEMVQGRDIVTRENRRLIGNHMWPIE